MTRIGRIAADQNLVRISGNREDPGGESREYRLPPVIAPSRLRRSRPMNEEATEEEFPKNLIRENPLNPFNP